MAMQRPSNRLIAQYDLTGSFKKAGIKCVINVQESGEHPFCGDGNVGDFSYDPGLFMDAGIFFYHFPWRDFGTPSPSLMLNIAHVMHFTIQSGGKVAVHCHAGLGRTGLVIASYLIYSEACPADEAVAIVRMHRRGSVQSRSQARFVHAFAEYVSQVRCIFGAPTPNPLFRPKKQIPNIASTTPEDGSSATSPEDPAAEGGAPTVAQQQQEEESDSEEDSEVPVEAPQADATVRRVAPFTLADCLKRQHLFLHGEEERRLRRIPKIVAVVLQRLGALCECATESAASVLSAVVSCFDSPLASAEQQAVRKHKENLNLGQWRGLEEEETNPRVLAILLFDWLNHLAEPVLYDAAVQTILGTAEPLQALRSLPPPLIDTASYITNALSTLIDSGAPIEITQGLCLLLADALVQGTKAASPAGRQPDFVQNSRNAQNAEISGIASWLHACSAEELTRQTSHAEELIGPESAFEDDARSQQPLPVIVQSAVVDRETDGTPPPQPVEFVAQSLLDESALEPPMESLLVEQERELAAAVDTPFSASASSDAFLVSEPEPAPSLSAVPSGSDLEETAHTHTPMPDQQQTSPLTPQETLVDPQTPAEAQQPLNEDESSSGTTPVAVAASFSDLQTSGETSAEDISRQLSELELPPAPPTIPIIDIQPPKSSSPMLLSTRSGGTRRRNLHDLRLVSIDGPDDLGQAQAEVPPASDGEQEQEEEDMDEDALSPHSLPSPADFAVGGNSPAVSPSQKKAAIGDGDDEGDAKDPSPTIEANVTTGDPEEAGKLFVEQGCPGSPRAITATPSKSLLLEDLDSDL